MLYPVPTFCLSKKWMGLSDDQQYYLRNLIQNEMFDLWVGKDENL